MTQRVPLTAEHAKNLFLERAAAYYDESKCRRRKRSLRSNIPSRRNLRRQRRKRTDPLITRIHHASKNRRTRKNYFTGTPRQDDALSEMPNKKTTPRLPKQKQIKRCRRLRDGGRQTAEKMMAFHLCLLQSAVCRLFQSSDWEWAGGGSV